MEGNRAGEEWIRDGLHQGRGGKRCSGDPGGGGGGHSGTEGGRTLVTYFAEEGVFF